jgi:serpin B
MQGFGDIAVISIEHLNSYNMKKVILKVGLMLLAVGQLTACSSSNSDDNNSPVETADDAILDLTVSAQVIQLTPEQRAFTQKNNDFSFNLFRAISNAEEAGKSVVASPLSVTFLMGMLNDGADGKTAEEIANVLGFGNGDKIAINAYCKALIEQAPVQDPRVKLQIANIVAANQGIELEDAFQQDMQNNYDAEVTSLDFGQELSLDYLNGWCNKKTNGMIPEIIDGLSAEDKMVLMNAIYFKATWQYYFEKKNTCNEPFTTASGSKKDVPMMQRKALLSYGKNDVYSAIHLPYSTGLWNMDILLPNEGKTVDDIINSLSASTWNPSHFYQTTTVNIKLPRFRTESDIDLNKIISDMGAPSMFSAADADFSLISKNEKNLWVGLMKHKAAIDVNEEGAEASGATAAMLVGGVGTVELKEANFHADHPFVYIISEMTSGAIFFIGSYLGD